MSDLLGIASAVFVGALLGAFFFGGLWWTIQKGINSSWAALWFIGSLLLRTTAVMAGFYFVSQHHWPRFAACVVGFLLTRFVVVKWLGRPERTLPEPSAIAAGEMQEYPLSQKRKKTAASTFASLAKDSHHEA